MHPSGARTELHALLRELRPYMARAAAFSVVSSLLLLAPSWYMLEVYDRVVNSRNHLTLGMLTLAVVFAYVVMEALEWVRSELVFSAGHHLDRRLSRRVFGLAFESTRKGLPEGGAHAVHDLRTLREFVHSPLPLAVMDAPASLVFLVLIFAISPVLGVAALAIALLQLLVTALNRSSTSGPMEAANRSASGAQHQADQMQLHAPVIGALDMYAPLRRRWLGKQGEALAAQAQASRRGGAYQALSKLLQNLANSLLLGLSCWLLLRDQLNGGGAMLVIAGVLGGRMLAPLVQAVSQWQALANACEAWSRLSKLLAALPAKEAGMPLPAPKGALAVDALVATAPGTQVPVIRGVGFELRPGEVLVVMGPSGSGKSSLARLLLGLWPAASGKVRLDGVDVFTWDKRELGPHLGYLPQAVELVEGSIADNIGRFGGGPREALEAAARAAGLHEFIESLPEGYDTAVGPNGLTLSGGQRQRIALARALCGDPALVVLDEPNSGLDEAGDAALVRAIAQHKQRGCTFVVISHRSHVLAVADKILLLREGQQQAFGPRDEVLAALREAQSRSGAAAVARAPSAPQGQST